MKKGKKKPEDREKLSVLVLEETRKFLEENRNTILYRAVQRLKAEGEK